MGYAPTVGYDPAASKQQDIEDHWGERPSAKDRATWLRYMLERMRFVRADWGWSTPSATSAPIVDEVAGQQPLFRISAILGSTPDAAHFNERQFATWAVATCPAAIGQLTDALARMERFVECAARGNLDAHTLQHMARDVLDAYARREPDTQPLTVPARIGAVAVDTLHPVADAVRHPRAGDEVCDD